ncbi:TonB family protein [Fulvivirga sediminis]|uniref:TonB family protein n=1 Tax=Fulvivirga sediminis TaxID=2803949 RepID=A0A937JXR8_9BACT|nr:TonB family protein [Fulvivirga sediminis]MBL3655733.1 TonB family protein [Fulvivirga sediminis]
MNNIINYFVEANICLVILGTFYFLCLQKDNHHRFIRFFLIGSGFLSVTLPLINLGSFMTEQSTNGSGVIKSIQSTFILPELTIFGSAGKRSLLYILNSYNWLHILATLYLLVSVVLITIFFFQICQILWLSKTKKAFKQDHFTFILTDGQLPTFSFFKLLFYDNSIKLSDDEKQKVIDHELVHIRQKHSWDIVFYELIKTMFWVNPIVWVFKLRLKYTHEYLADEHIIQKTSKEYYSHLLAKITLNQMSLGLAHHFNKSFTLNRIKMMNTPVSKFKTWKWITLIPIVTILFISISCNDDSASEATEAMSTAHQREVPKELQSELARLQQEYPEANFTYMETDADNEESMIKFKNLDPESIGYIKKYEDRGMIGVIVNQNGQLKKIAKATNLPDDEVFSIVEEPAMPEGGYENLYEKISQIIKYPLQARKKGIAGKVFVQFIINENGLLSDTKVVKGIGAGCDHEAMRALNAASLEITWKPALERGVKVKQKLILPITFALDDNDNNQSSINIDEVSNSGESQIKLDIKHDGLTVYGTVMNKEGKPLAGTNIIIEGTNQGSVSSIDGSFKIKLNTPKDKLIFSFMGFQTTSYSLEKC